MGDKSSLRALCCQMADSISIYRDELLSLLKPLDRDENAEARGFYLTAWNGTDSYIGLGFFGMVVALAYFLKECVVAIMKPFYKYDEATGEESKKEWKDKYYRSEEAKR